MELKMIEVYQVHWNDWLYLKQEEVINIPYFLISSLFVLVICTSGLKECIDKNDIF